MALQHEFVFISNEKRLDFKEVDWIELCFLYKEEATIDECIVLSDELIVYLLDFIHWVPVYYPAKRAEGFGIHYYGITKIEQQGAVIAEQLFCSLVSIFSLAPETIELTGQFQWGNDNNTDGEYERYVFDRDKLCQDLQSFIHLLRRVKNGEGYILHYGI
ncbi:TPA: coproporphyrinogen III oxidase [Bacillus cereus]|uniref:Coproporphyrinogen III oxidase n=1 Tax=Bacillus cereus TaxID=1396 RepID=A0A1D3NM38_BACCE|nr:MULTISPECIES: coproporphyrinogen III oxidase [Bacillus]MCP1179571.1 coproporphyrinogen III oxidase [Bacillus sp. 1663tsa1]MCP1285571.1 coproporphyrinogen III oxidase [Bacillus sp. S0635]MCQ6347862.1 coproporphyrinogen III oxidase [Bacillus cereus]MCU5459693.1 coproporphyrinogen III oxidase [Bacillus cereus]MCU5750185.1 coproporphyrinogen III oxidase [Bacillus cereus]